MLEYETERINEILEPNDLVVQLTEQNQELEKRVKDIEKTCNQHLEEYNKAKQEILLQKSAADSYEKDLKIITENKEKLEKNLSKEIKKLQSKIKELTATNDQVIASEGQAQ